MDNLSNLSNPQNKQIIVQDNVCNVDVQLNKTITASGKILKPACLAHFEKEKTDRKI